MAATRPRTISFCYVIFRLLIVCCLRHIDLRPKKGRQLCTLCPSSQTIELAHTAQLLSPPHIGCGSRRLVCDMSRSRNAQLLQHSPACKWPTQRSRYLYHPLELLYASCRRTSVSVLAIAPLGKKDLSTLRSEGRQTIYHFPGRFKTQFQHRESNNEIKSTSPQSRAMIN